MTCTDCDKRDKCTTPCKPVKKICWENNKVMEKHYPDHIEVFPGSTRERHFCELTDKQLDEISETDTIPWSSEDTRFRQTSVFIERFFKKTPCKELAEKFGVNENSIVCMYRDAVKRVHKIIAALDSRHEGMKAVSEKTFNQDEKIFLLCCCFGFNQHEVGKIFNMDHRKVHIVVKKMREKYTVGLKVPKKSTYEGMTGEQIAARISFRA